MSPVLGTTNDSMLAIVKAIQGLSDPEPWEWKPTLSAFAPASAQAVVTEPQQPAYEAFEAEAWYKAVENARIDTSMLAAVGGGKFLMEPHAANALGAMIAAAQANGIALTIGNTYRDYATQAAAYADYLAGIKQATVAKPGTSNHGWGLAVDFESMASDGEAFRWLAENAAHFGFTNPFGLSNPDEPWHWEFAQGAQPDPELLSSAGSTPRAGKPGVEPSPAAQPDMSAVSLSLGAAASRTSLANAITAMFSGETYKPPRGAKPEFKGDAADIKQQLYNGFMAAGRPDLAKMVSTRDFDTWVKAESGWNPYVTSQYFEGHGVNYGLFQFWQGHTWTKDYITGGDWVATPYEQAMLVAQYFPALSPDDIRRYAQQVRSGDYSGWPD